MIDLRANLVERRMVELDPLLAQHYLKLNVYETQRPLRVAHVNELALKMEEGLFRFGEVAFASKNDFGDILINGQHVCAAVMKSKVTVPCILEKFKVKNDMELSEAFRQFEILPRSVRDMVRVEAHALNLVWPLRVSAVVVAAAVLENYGGQRLNDPTGTGATSTSKGQIYTTRDDKVSLLKLYTKEGSFVNNILTLNNQSPGCNTAVHLCRAPVVLIMMKTWRKSYVDSERFWIQVRDGENLTKEMPAMKLREFLLTTRMVSTPNNMKGRTVSKHEYAYRCSIAWNAYRKNQTTNLQYRAENKLPNLI